MKILKKPAWQPSVNSQLLGSEKNPGMLAISAVVTSSSVKNANQQLCKFKRLQKSSPHHLSSILQVLSQVSIAEIVVRTRQICNNYYSDSWIDLLTCCYVYWEVYIAGKRIYMQHISILQVTSVVHIICPVFHHFSITALHPLMFQAIFIP